MVSKLVTVQNRAGVHTRPAALISQKANEFSSDISLIKDKTTKINAKSLIGLITMIATYGTELELTCEGTDENEAMEAIESLFVTKFGEE